MNRITVINSRLQLAARRRRIGASARTTGVRAKASTSRSTAHRFQLSPGPHRTRGPRVRSTARRLRTTSVRRSFTPTARSTRRAAITRSRLHIGSTQATVDGQQQTLDVAPFIIGASTYVPLRFVSQALGATRELRRFANQIVALTTNGGPGAAPAVLSDAQQPPQQQPQRQAGCSRSSKHPSTSALTLRDVQPGRTAPTVDSRRPTIQAAVRQRAQADPNTVQGLQHRRPEHHRPGLAFTAKASCSHRPPILQSQSAMKMTGERHRRRQRLAVRPAIGRSSSGTQDASAIRSAIVRPADGATRCGRYNSS